MKEIGSEYWRIDLNKNKNNLEYLTIGSDYKLFMSGRTSIDYVLNEISNNKKSVYMPDYCCMSMIQPFIDNGYEVKYYSVDLLNNRYNIDLNFNCSIFFAMNYFGYNQSSMDKYIKEFSKKNIIIIEDITHRFLSKKNYCEDSDYLICSLRKWFPIISGGTAINVKDNFKNNLDTYFIDTKFVNSKYSAMKLKREYIDGFSNNKEEFLKIFKTTNEKFLDYKNKKMDDISINILKHINIDEIKKIRRRNASLIERKLKNNKKVKLIYNLCNEDVPLYVPVILEQRDDIRCELIKEKIYCPIHWPNFNQFENPIYKNEISLICDQRYSEEDIEKYIEKLIKIVGE